MKSEFESRTIALGFFDGVHQGHGALFETVTSHVGKSSVLTFDCHPESQISSQKTPLITTLEDRKWLISTQYHIHDIIVLDFNEVHNMDWYDFIADYLKNQLSVTHVVAGHDFRFGHNGEGDAQKLQQTCTKLQMTCDIIPAVTLDNVVISSTHIRSLIMNGNMAEAVKFLGHPFILSNTVQHGNKIGSTVLGFPTVNLSIPEDVITPAFGVYACRIWVGERVFHAVTNVGIRPTVTDEIDKSVTVEGFLLDFPDEELYGRTLRVEFYHFLRPEKKFDDFSALTKQISQDVENTKAFFAHIPLPPC